MITIKNDNNLLRAAEMVGKEPHDIQRGFEAAVIAADLQDMDGYAGEALLTLLDDMDIPDKLFVFAMTCYHPLTEEVMDAFYTLLIYLPGAEKPCPYCGYEIVECTEDHTWFCPHCGWNELKFLGVQNED